MIALLLVAGAILWSQRTEIASGLVDRELARRGVPARYRVTEIGFTTQRIEDVVIGDPRAPDLTADWAELSISVGLNGPVVTGASAGGVRLRGQIVDGRLRLGAVDRLLPAPTPGRPLTLPDFDVALNDARIDLETAAGRIAARIDGRGNLASGFAGRVVARAPQLALGGCSVEDVVAAVGLDTDDRRPLIDGPIRVRSARCGSLGLESATVQVDAVLGEAFDRWQGIADFDVARLEAVGGRVDGMVGQTSFAGTGSGTEGRVALTGRQASVAGARAERAALSGDWSVGSAASIDGELSLASTTIERGVLAPLGRIWERAAGTPIAPILSRISGASAAALREFALRARFSVRQEEGRGLLRLSRLDANSASGARLALADGAQVAFAWPDGARRLDGQLTMGGGGLPAVQAVLRQPRATGAIGGLVRIAPYAADGSSVALAPVRFTTGGGGVTRITTRARLDGPLAGGRVEGLELPLAAQLTRAGALLIDPGCLPVQYQLVAIGAARLSPGAFELCPAIGRRVVGAGGLVPLRIAAPAIQGVIGSTPLSVAAASALVRPRDAGFQLTDMVLGVGNPARRTDVEIAQLDGRLSQGVIAGQFAGGGATIGGVPLVIGDAAGDWRFAAGTLALDGEIALTDALAPGRFERLIARDMRFSLGRDGISADATLRLPANDAQIVDVAIRHDLGSGRGSAALSVPGIRFTPDFQPEALTRLTLGVVADVDALVSGAGQIGWSPEGVTSTGEFGTENASLAAAFGPVTGLTTQMRFVDLLALETAPGQVATVASVNPGIEILNGAIRFRLLPERRVEVAGGSWPLAGGTLTLEPTLLDFAEQAERRMVFDVNALDAAKFIGRFEFEDLAATGTFDGRLPILFDRDGGRIEGGSLTSREGGGTLAYNGELSDADLGTWGKLAFDALRSIRYDQLTIALDGAIDGEMVTQVRFGGVNRATPRTRASMILSQFTNLPFLFNIRVEAPFRGLLASLRGFGDPEELIRERLPDALNPPPGAAVGGGAGVQPPVSRPAS